MEKNYTKLMLKNYSYILFLELCFKFFVLKTYDIGILYITIFSLFLANIVTCLTCLFKSKKVNFIINILIWIFLLFIFSAETIYYSFYNTICGLSALYYGGQIMEFFNEIIVHIKDNVYLIIIYFIPAIIFIILKLIGKTNYKRSICKVSMVLLISTFFFAFSSLELFSNETDSAKNLIFNKNDLMQTTNKLGVMQAVVFDATKFLIKFEEKIELKVQRKFTMDLQKEYNITDIDFQSKIESETDTTVKKMHEYFSNEEATEKNEYTGIFAGKNLIFIVAEGFSPIAVDETLTPTLYKLVNSSFVFNNYYQPIYNCSTSDGEFINQLSILPGVATCSMKETTDVYLPLNLGIILDKYGYSTNAFHGWTYNYYARDKVMPNLGYTYYGYDKYKRGYKYALKGIKDSWPTSDIDVINASYDIYSHDKMFMAYYMSISGHLEYNFMGGNAMATKNKKYVSDLSANNSIKAYIATQIEFDKSMELLLNKLESDNLLKDTVIVISPDHYPYGLKTNDIKEYLDNIDNENFDLYKNNLIIYNSEMERVDVDKYSSSLDLLPTLLNLFGIKYDSRLLIGKDIFSSSDDLVIFNNKSWITNKGRYDYMKKKYESFVGEEVEPKEYINEINQIVDMKFQMSKLIISKNYYKKLGGL